MQAAVAEAETALEQARAAKDATAIEAAQNALVENEEELSPCWKRASSSI